MTACTATSFEDLRLKSQPEKALHPLTQLLAQFLQVMYLDNSLSSNCYEASCFLLEHNLLLRLSINMLVENQEQLHQTRRNPVGKMIDEEESNCSHKTCMITAR
jgi:hypothetical protein